MKIAHDCAVSDWKFQLDVQARLRAYKDDLLVLLRLAELIEERT